VNLRALPLPIHGVPAAVKKYYCFVNTGTSIHAKSIRKIRVNPGTHEKLLQEAVTKLDAKKSHGDIGDTSIGCDASLGGDQVRPRSLLIFGIGSIIVSRV